MDAAELDWRNMGVKLWRTGALTEQNGHLS